jgi:hypothetical protein
MKKINTSEFVARANIIHNNKYSYPDLYVGYQVKICIICPIHGAFNQTPAAHLFGKGCLDCGFIERANKSRGSYDDFVRRATVIHNGKYIYPDAQAYINIRTKLNIICPIHSNFTQRPDQHLAGAGCIKCGHIKTAEAIVISYEEFVKRSRTAHNETYNYPDTNYIDNATPIGIECPIHGIFKQQPKSHWDGSGCPECFRIKYSKTTEQFIEDANKIHNNRYQYPEPYINCRTPINIWCSKHGIFAQMPTDHLHGSGCPSCSINTVSKPEIAWLNYLGIPQEYRQATLKIGKTWVKTDAFDPRTNTVYEFYGDYWHGNPAKFDPNKIHHLRKISLGDLYRATIAREELIKQAGYNVVSIWESDWEKIAKQMDSK